jgi:hypothetical protein
MVINGTIEGEIINKMVKSRISPAKKMKNYDTTHYKANITGIL